jgi:hypothetical protein
MVSSQRKEEEEKDNAETQRSQRRRRGRFGKKIYTEGAKSTEFGEERTGNTGFTSRGCGEIGERFLAAQADPFAEANGCRKMGLLRSE